MRGRNVNRRDVLKVLAGAGVLLHAPRVGLGTPRPDGVFWVHVQAMGGWDPALTCDPKPALRKRGLDRDIPLYSVPIPGPVPNGPPARGTGLIRAPRSTVVRATPGSGIPYLGFADLYGDSTDPTHPYRCFFPTYHDRITVFNGIDTGTNNHEIGVRYCSAGSVNEGFPCFATQVAAARGPERPLAFVNLGGYAETAGLLPATTLVGPALQSFQRLTAPNDRGGDNQGDDTIVSPGVVGAIREAHARRIARLRDRLKLPDQRRALDAMAAADAGMERLSSLHFNARDGSLANVIAVAVDAYRQGLAVSMNIPVSGFDSHGDNEQAQAQALYEAFEAVKAVLAETETPKGGKPPVPAVVVVSSDFGRSPYYRNLGTDHWPVTSMMIVQNALASLPVPTNAVIGATSDGDAAQALRPLRVDPRTLRPHSEGVTLTPGHVMRALRRLAGIDGSPRLGAWPLTVERDLALG
jgi:hypothetical protein